MRITQFAPRVYENETIYSIASRSVLNDISGSVSQGIENITGSRSIQLDAIFPSYLAKLAAHTRIELDVLICDFSLLPYFSLFAPEQARGNAVRALQNGNSSAAFKSLGLLVTRINTNKYHRFCPRCAIEQDFTYGEAYWLRHHQLPLVSVCTTHKCDLEQMPRKRKQLVFPDINRSPVSSNNEVALKLAEISESLLGMPTFDLPKLRLCYAIRLIDKKLATTESLNIAGLRMQMRKYYETQALELDVDTLLNETNEHGYPANLFYAKKAAHHPLKHVLLIAFLFDHFGDFIVSYTNASQATKVALEARKAVSQTELDKVRRSDVITTLRSGLSLRQTMRHSKVSAATVRNIAKDIGVSLNRRSQTLPQMTHRAIIIKLMVGLPSTFIAKQLGCTIYKVEKVLTREPEIKRLRRQVRFYERRKFARKNVLRIISNPNKASIKSLREDCYNDYVWLYEKDTAWLAKTIETLKNKGL
jgi:hypothetical protein